MQRFALTKWLISAGVIILPATLVAQTKCVSNKDQSVLYAATCPNGFSADATQACMKALSDAKKECSGGGTSGLISLASQATLSVLSSTTFDAKSMCSAGDMQAYGAIAGSGYVEYACAQKVSICQTQCANVTQKSQTQQPCVKEEVPIAGGGKRTTQTGNCSTGNTNQNISVLAESYQQQCSDAQTRATQALAMSGVSAMQILANARVCNAYFASQTQASPFAYPSPPDECTTAQASSFVQCQQYCTANPTSPVCPGVTGSPPPGCTSIAQYQANPSCATPTGLTQLPPGISGTGPTGLGALPGGDAVGAPPTFPGDVPTNPAYTGNAASNNSTQPGLGNDNGNGGGNGVGVGGAYPGGAPPGQTAQQPGASGFKDPGGGVAGGAGGGFSVSGVPLSGGGGNPFGKTGKNANDKGPTSLDLSKFLPGGELDPKRGPASVALQAQGITSANDLSNFEKVSRMMNRKRPFLKPGDGK